MAIQSSQSQPGQFAAAVKAASPRARAAALFQDQPTETGIDHGHHGEQTTTESILHQLVPTPEDIARVARPHPRPRDVGTPEEL